MGFGFGFGLSVKNGMILLDVGGMLSRLILGEGQLMDHLLRRKIKIPMKIQNRNTKCRNMVVWGRYH